MSEQQHQLINAAFAEAVPEAGPPQIVDYPGGAYTARATRDNVSVDVKRTAEGEVTAQYTTSGPNAMRGVATADTKGGQSSQMVFGPEGDRTAQHAASRLARTLATAGS